MAYGQKPFHKHIITLYYPFLYKLTNYVLTVEYYDGGHLEFFLEKEGIFFHIFNENGI